MNPVVIVNFKAYERGYGTAAKELAKACATHGAWVAVQPTEIASIAADSAVRVLAQHVDAITYGAHTGSILPEAVKHAGAYGTLINHSEKRLTNEEVGTTVTRCKELGLFTVVCAESIERAEVLQQYAPDLLAVEIPELIGGDVSIVSARPGIVSEAVSRLGSNVLLGAGVNSGEDLKEALSQGAKGVILASAIVKKAHDPKQALQELYSAVTYNN